MDADGYMVNGAVNIGWGAFDLAETLKKELDLPVTVKAGNDANVAAWVKCGRAVVKAIPIW